MARCMNKIAQYILFSFLMINESCSANIRNTDSYEDYSQIEADFLKDSESLLFGKLDSIYPLGGDLEIKQAVMIDGYCYSKYVSLWGNAAFAEPFNPRNFWSHQSGVGALECDRKAFFDDFEFGEPYQPKTKPEFGIDGEIKKVIKRRSRLFVSVSQKASIPIEWAAYRFKVGYFFNNAECAPYVKRDKYGDYNIFLSFARKNKGTMALSGQLDSRDERRKLFFALAESRTFGQCIVRTLSLARGLEGSATVPDSFFVVEGPLRRGKFVPSGCAVDDGISEPHSLNSELLCVVPSRKAGLLSGWLMWALDGTDSGTKTYTRGQFRDWIRKWLPPGNAMLARQIELQNSAP
jgi:hypothetical protein